MMRTITALFILIIIVAAFTEQAFAVTYYIDFDNGSDTNSGLLQSAPWKTIPGTRNVADTDWQSMDWGSGTININNKVPAGTIFKLKRGTTHSIANGGLIWIAHGFYKEDATALNPITFELDESWSNGDVTFDGTGMTVGISMILIQVDGVKFDGKITNGIVIQDSPLGGVQVKEHAGTGNPTNDSAFHYMKFYNNGTTCTTGSECSTGQVNIRHGDGLEISYLQLDGNLNHLQGLVIGESNKRVIDATISNSIAYNHAGDDPPNDSGIGFKAFNSQATYTNCTSHSNLKGFDLGEQNGNDRVITYKVVNSTSWNNTWGINMNSAANAAYSGAVNFYIINSIIRDNTFLGANIYSTPFNLHVIHSVFDNNGTDTPTEKQKGNINVTPNSGTDSGTAAVYLYNNVFYKPAGHCNLCNKYFSDTNLDFVIDSDYNAWVEDTGHSNGEFFAIWSAQLSPACNFSYDANGPANDSGSWFDEKGCDDTANSRGHQGSDSNSVLTFNTFTDVVNHDYTLTEPAPGTDISSKSWYISEMGKDRTGLIRIIWNMGAYEYGTQNNRMPNPPSKPYN